ncbi:unnamed protein product [Auanema sp. JU1783]|nr:unnamed protein product [Auanema sp. JU1783]
MPGRSRRRRNSSNRAGSYDGRSEHSASPRASPSRRPIYGRDNFYGLTKDQALQIIHPSNSSDEPINEPDPHYLFLLQQSEKTSKTLNYVKNHVVRQTLFPFDSYFIRRLLNNKHVMFMGDSLTRALYKDLVVLLQTDDITNERFLKMKSEYSHFGDRQIDILPLESDRIFRQAREYMSDNHLVQYVFTSRVMKNDVEKALLNIFKTKEYPDLIVLNSAIWDVTRYNLEPTNMYNIPFNMRSPRTQINNELVGMEEYCERVAMLMRRLRLILPATTQVIWVLYPWPMPIDYVGMSTRVGANDKRQLHRSLYLDANYRAAQIVRTAGYDVLDLGFFMRNHALYTFRCRDGVHWTSVGTRIMSQLLIGHVSMNICLPKYIEDRLAEFSRNLADHGPKFYDGMNRGVDGDDKGSHAEIMQQKLRKTFFNNLNADTREAIKQDVQLLRFVDLIRSERLLENVSPEIADYIVNMVHTKSLSTARICKNDTQRIMISVGEKYLSRIRANNFKK